MGSPIKTLIVHKSTATIEVLRAFLAEQPSIDVVGDCLTSQEVKHAIVRHNPSLILIESDFLKSGEQLSAARKIHRLDIVTRPHSGPEKVLISDIEFLRNGIPLALDE